MPALHHRDFRYLWAATTISAAGSWLLIIAAPVYVYQRTGSTTATALTLAIESLPTLLLGPWAGVLVDRWHRATTLTIANLAAATAIALLFLGTVPALYTGLLIESAALVFAQPATRAILPDLVGTGTDLAAANSIQAFTGGALRLAGPLLGAALLTAGGLPLVVAIDVASYLAAAALTARIAPVVVRPSGVRRGLRNGLRYLWHQPTLRGLLITTFAFFTANAGLTALLVPLVSVRLGRTGADLGYLITGLGAGYPLGAACSRRLLRRYPTRTLLTCGYTAIGLSFLAMSNAPTLTVAAAAAAAAGIPGAIVLVANQHQIQTSTPAPLLGRVGAAFYASDAAAALVGALLAPAATAALGLGGALNAFSVAALATAVAAWLLIPPAPLTRLGRLAPLGRLGRLGRAETWVDLPSR